MTHSELFWSITQLSERVDEVWHLVLRPDNLQVTPVINAQSASPDRDD